ncbi:vestitone reductase-like [Cucumis melo var. makuwa]|uniref:Vestitone reductase-like n=1 Tax=Cucumis melo var. makuwa TaxID=1194695 RepID=A0A5D3D2U9_CUCMM|nr:vestitone reductase-like [Cucumis melo var. makuwa]
MAVSSSSGCLRVCVTCGSGYVASSFIKKLLLNGHIVHATLRNLDDESKIGILKRLPNATTNLVLFKADIYEPHEFEAAIRGCHIVFHVATPLHHTHATQYSDVTEASVAAAKMIAKLCVELGTVRRLIYTASVVSMSPMKDDGSGFKDVLDENCWTPLKLSYPFSNSTVVGYVDSKTATEKELLKFGESEESMKLEVVTLACGLIAGDTLHPSPAATTTVTFSQFIDESEPFKLLRFLEELDGKVPLVHIDDVCEAHIFCMEQTSIHGRFLCATSFLSSPEIANYYHLHHSHLQQKHGKLDEVAKRNIKMNSKKLIERGFIYKYDGDMILEDVFHCCKNQFLG